MSSNKESYIKPIKSISEISCSAAKTEVDFKIYDRWGGLLFETNDQQLGWDGTFKDKPLAPAVFVYYLKVRCENQLEYFSKGNVTLIR